MKFKSPPKLMELHEIFDLDRDEIDRLYLAENSLLKFTEFENTLFNELPSGMTIQVWELEDEPEPEKVCDKTIEIDGVKYKLVPEDQ
jgi:hypothetical protein